MAELKDRVLAQASGLTALARSLASPAEAEDLVQDTLLTGIVRGERSRTLGPWLRQVLRNNLRMRIRGERRRRDREGLVPTAKTPSSVEDRIAEAELADALRKTLDQLDEPLREVLRLRFLEGHSGSEVARMMDVAPGTVRWRIHEGLARIRATLDERFGSRDAWFGCVVGLTVAKSASAGSIGVTSMMKPRLVATLAGASALAVAAFINGMRLVGAREVRDLQRIIDRERERLLLAGDGAR